jgi:hypothetical protein
VLINAVAAIIVMRFFWPAVLMLFAFAGVNLGLSLDAGYEQTTSATTGVVLYEETSPCWISRSN